MSKRECNNRGRQIVVVIISVFAFSFSWGQGIVRGKVTDENGEPAIGATVVVKSNRTIGSAVSIDGDYSVKLLDSATQILLVSFVGYSVIEFPVQVSDNKVVIKNFDLKPAATEMKEVEIVAKAPKAKSYYMEKVKMNSVTTLDYISSETMKRTGDANVTAAIARVSGVSTTNSGFITVRGMGDRYVRTNVNGFRIPTLDPFTNNIKLDLFPSSLVDNIIITKTASADLPADWSGAYISIESKEYPEKFMLNVETSVGYNARTTFKEILSTQTSPTDVLGYDNGFRDYNHKNFSPVILQPTTYDEFVALGLGSYYQSLGITSPWATGPAGDVFTKLGLLQLGLLSPADIKSDKNDVAYKTALAKYNDTYKPRAFNAINADASNSAKKFPNNWSLSHKNAPLDFSQGFSIGNQTTFLKRPFGLVAGFRYGRTTIADNKAVFNTVYVGTGGIGYDSSYQKVSNEVYGWSALINAAYKLNSNNNISILFMPNMRGENKSRYQTARSANGNYVYMNTINQYYESRNQFIYQVKTEQYIPSIKSKIELNASYTDAGSKVPDFKSLDIYEDQQGNYFFDTKLSEPTRFYRYLNEDVFDSKLNFEIPIGEKPRLPRKIKTGVAYQYSKREFRQIGYRLFDNSGIIDIPISNNNVDAFFNNLDFELGTKGIINNYYNNYLNSPSNKSFGNINIMAGYILTDYSLSSSLRFSVGVRAEKVKQYTDVFLYDSLKYAYDDPRRKTAYDPYLINSGKLDTINFLPSANVIYKLKKDENSPINLRLNYSQTVARPSLRELSDIIILDYELNSEVVGYSSLKPVHVYNYDVRVESYFQSGSNLSVSLFYKDFRNHIELINAMARQFMWTNVKKSYVYGVELEGMKKINKNFSIGGNITYVKSLSTFEQKRFQVSTDGKIEFIIQDTLSRVMFGQSPYIINSILTYKSDSLGLEATASFNMQGPKLSLASGDGRTPDIYDMPRNMLDIKISKKIGSYFSVSITARNLLDAPIKRSYLFKNGDVVDFDSFRYGSGYVLGVSYKL